MIILSSSLMMSSSLIVLVPVVTLLCQICYTHIQILLRRIECILLFLLKNNNNNYNYYYCNQVCYSINGQRISSSTTPSSSLRNSSIQVTTLSSSMTLSKTTSSTIYIRRYSHLLSLLFFCLSLSLSLQVSTIHASFIDIDTPLDKRTTTSFVDGTEYELVMSDEFNVENRTFGDGDDSVWTALDKSDDDASSAGGGSMQFYNSSNVRTTNGMLQIKTLVQKTSWNRYDPIKKQWEHVTTNFTSGMVQSWEKFCFTGGIIELDVIYPGDPYIGGLWPAIWMLGNLGRATYEASTNNLWPWSYNTCNRSLQLAQTISACNKENHFGMKPYTGRGSTEIDIAEVMTGTLTGGLSGTNPKIDYPYCDFTLQVAPGVIENRPQSGRQPARRNTVSASGHTEFIKDTWYDGLEMNGNTSINPFFYGTYLAETKPNEPVTRTAQQAFQADAIGAAHQLTPSHFDTPHTFRLEWQPGPGGRLDWYVKNYKYVDKTKVNQTKFMDGDGNGQEWLHAYSIQDDNIQQLMGSQIPIEPTYLIFNVAVSSTWGFPYDIPEWCTKCYDCDDPKCACSFYPGFCQMLKSETTSMYIDYIRVYQSKNDTAHVGAPHTLGCDPPEYPTKEWIRGHEYRYMRNPPFSLNDKHPLKSIQNGGGICTTDNDCGSNITSINITAQYEQQQQQQQGNESTTDDDASNTNTTTTTNNGRGHCVTQLHNGLFGRPSVVPVSVCQCFSGYTGPYCLALDHIDDTPKAHVLSHTKSPFSRIYRFQFPGFLVTILVASIIALLYILLDTVRQNKKLQSLAATAKWNIVRANNNNNSNNNANSTSTSNNSINNPQVRHLYGTGVPYQHIDEVRNEKDSLIN